MFYFTSIHILSFFAKLFYRIKYVGLEHIPAEGKLIVCSNHKSIIDPLFLAVPFKRQIRYMAKSELFEDHGWLVSKLLVWLGAFPVKRDKGDARSIRTAVDILNRQEVVGIFPQGKCVFDQTPFRPKAGAVMLAAKTNAPILPASIYCDGVIRLFSRVTIRFGQVIPASEFSLKDLRSSAEILAGQINQMLEEKD